jgi:hypothetical protein
MTVVAEVATADAMVSCATCSILVELAADPVTPAIALAA